MKNNAIDEESTITDEAEEIYRSTKDGKTLREIAEADPDSEIYDIPEEWNPFYFEAIKYLDSDDLTNILRKIKNENPEIFTKGNELKR